MYGQSPYGMAAYGMDPTPPSDTPPAPSAGSATRFLLMGLRSLLLVILYG